MPLATVSGFIKKRTVSQQYHRSPRQLTRDITVAIEMGDETVLPHLLIRNEDGSIIEGTKVTPDVIKDLRAKGRNPSWHLRQSWVETNYGRRSESDQRKGESVDESEAKAPVVENETATAESANPSIVTLMQESIRELKRDKELLTEQLKNKDEQIRETTERWKETNVISHSLSKRLEAMEKQFKLGGSILGESTDEPNKPTISNEPASDVETETDSVDISKPVVDSKPPKKRPAKSKRGVVRKSVDQTTKPKKQPAPKWYELPTLKKFLSRSK